VAGIDLEDSERRARVDRLGPERRQIAGVSEGPERHLTAPFRPANPALAPRAYDSRHVQRRRRKLIDLIRSMSTALFRDD
jgi:hypothetical protein